MDRRPVEIAPFFRSCSTRPVQDSGPSPRERALLNSYCAVAPLPCRVQRQSHSDVSPKYRANAWAACVTCVGLALPAHLFVASRRLSTGQCACTVTPCRISTWGLNLVVPFDAIDEHPQRQRRKTIFLIWKTPLIDTPEPEPKNRVAMND